ncbi:alpha/beta fold hydrolase [Leptolyngbya iicbica]|uniref:Alpha/beta hydrolase n=2 Tax=Cyanophyceae TaxID=3028117 RepID=A0A4V2E1T7_9CYAN|nr:alpha/beta hydrolase [Leptolyngbya sp. LK]RZM75239.1 alpha/beta hydrolase [Leptolyngbya sp. LK]
MLQFLPPGFEQKVTATSLGIMAYYTQAADRRWATASDAAEPATLVCLHSLGGGSSAYEWSKIYGALAADYRIIAPDLVGWGQSAHPEREYCTEDYCDIIAHLIEQVAGAPAIVAATSLTAGVVVRLAIQRPELFQALFLVSPSGNDDFGVGYGYSLPAILAGTPVIDRLIYQFGAANETAVTQFLTNFLFAHPDRITAEIVQAYTTCTQQPNAEYSALASLKGNVCFDLTRYIGQLTVPTTIVVGEKSRFNRPDKTKRMAAMNRAAIQTVHVVPDVGVLPHVEEPSVVVGLLRAFLRQTLATERPSSVPVLS